MVETVLEETQGLEPLDLPAEVARILALHAWDTAQEGPAGQGICEACMEEGPALACDHCDRAFHSLCLQPPALTGADVPDGHWDCPCCLETNTVRLSCVDVSLSHRHALCAA